MIGTYMHHAWLTHTLSTRRALLMSQCMNALHTMHHHFLLFIITYVQYQFCSVFFDWYCMYTSTWYSSFPLCEHRIIHRYGTYGLMCMYTSHICRLMPTHTVIFIVHVCGNALHIGTQINCMSKLNCRMCIKKTGQDRVSL